MKDFSPEISSPMVQSAGSVIDSSPSGFWSEDLEKKPRLIGRFLKDFAAVGISLAVASSPPTAPLEIVFNERRWREETTTTWIFQKARGRLISIHQAREMALKLMQELEENRLLVFGLKAELLLNSEDDI